MKINNTKSSPYFGAYISKSVMPMIAVAKGVCPLHKKPLLFDVINTMKNLFPENTISRTNKEISLLRKGKYGVWPVKISYNTGDKINDLRSIAAGLQWAEIRVGKYGYNPVSQKQKTRIEAFHKKWDGFLNSPYWKKKKDLKLEGILDRII